MTDQKRFDEAVACYRKALEINPHYISAYGNFVPCLKQICAWKELEYLESRLDELTTETLNNKERAAETPFVNLMRCEDISRNFEVARSWSQKKREKIRIEKSENRSRIAESRREKIRIGYLSNDFRDHPVAHLITGLFKQHKRQQFEIFCYSYGKDDKSEYRKEIQTNCDKFADIQYLSDADAAKQIINDQINILIDLTGYTTDNRMEICVYRPAPVQVNYLGFPGTTGSDFFDYIITDRIVTPEEHSLFYSEKFVFMPHCYMVNDNTQEISDKKLLKKDFDLPDDCFVFCSFNQNYKIEPVMFDVWMQILRNVPKSILWLSSGNETAEKNLKHEASARNISNERLIFAKRIQSKAEHFARLKLADIVLDTRIYNGHTTTCDALWAGVPVITLQGKHFASRVSSSILTAAGIPELITYSLDEYKDLAVKFGNNSEKLQAIRQNLEKNRLICPLFDTRRFTKNLENAYKAIWNIFLSGKTPQQINVTEEIRS